MKKILLILSLALLSVAVVGCGNSNLNNSTTINEKGLQKYLEDIEFEVVSYEGESGEYTVTKELLAGKEPSLLHHLQVWQLLEAYGEVNAKDFINKSIKQYKFKVQNHPLDNAFGEPYTNVWLIVCENKIIGGCFFLESSENLYGGPYPLNGIQKEWEELTGKSYPEWIDDWMEKYDK